MNDPIVTLTDYFLTAECLVFVFILARIRNPVPRLRFWFVAIFFMLACGSLMGGTVHGFFPDHASAGYRFFWSGTLIDICLAGFSMWMAAALMLFMDSAARTVLIILSALWTAVLIGLVVFGEQSFYIALAGYLPSALLLILAFAVFGAPKWGVIGLILTFVAAGLQAARITIHPVYFDHNVLYHVVQAIGLWLGFIAARHVSAERG